MTQPTPSIEDYNSAMNDEYAAASLGVMTNAASASAGQKRDAPSSPLPPRLSASKKPRDERLRDCFIITPLEGGGENIICKHCPDYNKTLQKFNPTKSRAHLTTQCTGVDEQLRQILLETTQAARKSLSAEREHGLKLEHGELGGEGGGVAASSLGIPAADGKTPGTGGRGKKGKGRTSRPSPAYISFHTDDTCLDVTAPIENGEPILRLAFPSDNLKINFNAKTGTEAASLCIDGFMNMKADASWTASMCSMTNEGTRAGPHCQWPLSRGENGKWEFDGELNRAQRVEQLLKTMTML